MDLEDTMPSEINQTKISTVCGSKNYNKLVNVREDSINIEDKPVASSGQRCKIGVGEWEVLRMRCNRDSSMYCTTWRI